VGTFTFGEGLLLFTPDASCPVLAGDRLLSGTTRLAVGPGAPALECGLRWFPPSAAWRLSAWVEGTILRFPAEGREHRWAAQFDPEGGAVSFGDLTNGVETAPAGRLLRFGPPRHGLVLLDFNRAVTLPGARTPFGEHPPVTNHTEGPIRAGEKYPHAGLSAGGGI